MKKRHRFKALLNILIVFLGTAWIFYYYFGIYNEKVNVEDIYVNEYDQLIIKLDNEGKCSLIGGIEESRWVNTNSDNACILEKQDSYNTLYLRNKHTYLSEYDKDISYLNSLDITNKSKYLAVNAKMNLKYSIDSYGLYDKEVVYSSSNEDVASIDEQGIITGINNGKATITIQSSNKEDSIDIIVTDLIIPIKEEYDFDKPFIECKQYTKQDNDLFDEILKDRVNDAGYSTRAAAVAAARFFEFELPFQVAYFSENGRIDSYMNHFADGEGRYYHEGLYLDESRYENLDPEMIVRGPACWGCRLYELDGEKYIDNGLDCSGYISWILLQAGYDPGDLGAGIAEWEDLTKLGTLIEINKAVNNDLIRVGDLLSGSEISAEEGGHIAFVIGKDDDYYYTSEALWEETGYFGVVVVKHSKQELIDNFYWSVDMNDFYKQDGNLTDLWFDS